MERGLGRSPWTLLHLAYEQTGTGSGSLLYCCTGFPTMCVNTTRCAIEIHFQQDAEKVRRTVTSWPSMRDPNRIRKSGSQAAYL